MQFPTDLVTFTQEILNGKLHFLCNALFYHIVFQINFNSSSSFHVMHLFDFKTLFEQKMCIYENILCKRLHKEIT